MNSTVLQIKDRLSAEDVISSYIKLEKAGKNLRAKCPFHNEKTPSFYVSPERGSFYCFGCGAKGDIFTFVEQFEGLDFYGALKVLAERAGVEIISRHEGQKDERERLFSALEKALVYYEDILKGNTEAVLYLKERGLEDKMISEFRVGLSQETWRALYDHLGRMGFSESELLEAGLLKKGEAGKPYDVFRGRIMFPIFDASGRVIAFSGRLLPSVSEDLSRKELAKYINSPETPLFHKSFVLYGYDKAKSAMRKYNFCIVVEGQIDVIMSHQTEFKNAVAPLGTALTREHLESVKRLTKNLVLALDADGAGVASARRGAELALEMGFDVKVAKLQRGMDPADVIHKDSLLWRKAIRSATHIVNFLLSVLRETIPEKRSFQLAVSREVLPYVARIENRIDQAHFIKVVAEELGVSERPIYEEVGKIRLAGPPGEKEIPRAYAHIRQGDGMRELLGLIVWQRSLSTPDIDVSATTQRLLELTGAKSLNDLLSRYDHEELAFEAEREAERTVFPEEKALELLARLEINELEREKENVRTEDLKRFQELSKKIDAMKRNIHAGF